MHAPSHFQLFQFSTYGKDGTEYSPTGCIVVNHQTIQCTTVPGVGFDLFWQIEVRGQRSILNAVNQISPSNPAPGTTFSIREGGVGLGVGPGSGLGVGLAVLPPPHAQHAWFAVNPSVPTVLP